jgi:hypothetical protein
MEQWESGVAYGSTNSSALLPLKTFAKFAVFAPFAISNLPLPTVMIYKGSVFFVFFVYSVRQDKPG